MKIKLWHIFAFALLFRLVLAPLANHPDVGNHIDWGIRFYEYGADKFYAPESNVWSFTWPNQPPGTILIFAFIRKVYELIFGVLWKINILIPAFPSVIVSLVDTYLYPLLLKVPAILADLGIAFLIYKFLIKLKHKKAATVGAVLFLFNPVIWYNSSVWGQTDSVINFFALLSLWLLFARRPTFSALSFAVSLYIKVSLAIFIPIFVILFIKQRFSFKQILMSAALPLVLFVVFTLPFSLPNEPISWLISIYREKVLTNQMQVITANAFNFWAVLTGIHEKPHSLLLGPISYQSWGYLLFGSVLIPILIRLWKSPTVNTAIWTIFLTGFSSWLLLTNMHERYLYPIFPYFTILALLSAGLLPFYIVLSGVNLLNLYNLWWTPRIEIVKNMLVAYDHLSTRFFGLVSTGIFIVIYKKNIISIWGEKK